MRAAAVLHDLAALVRAGLDQDGEAAGAEPEPVEAVGPVRPAEVLPALRAAERQWRQARRLRRSRQLLESRPAADCGIVRQRRLRHVRPSRSRAPCGASAAYRHHRRRSGRHRPGDRGQGRRRPARPRGLRAASCTVRTIDADARGVSAGRSCRPTPVAPRTTRSSTPSRTRRRGAIDAIATAPINKEAFALAGLPWKGHTDLLAHLTGTPRVAMMFYAEALRVVLATIHVPLADVPGLLTRELLDFTIDLTARELPRFGYPRPRHRGRRTESARRRAWRDRRRRRRGARARRSRRRARAASTSPARGPADTIFVRAVARRVRRRDRLLSRPGVDSGEAAGVRPGRQRDAGAADHPHVGRSRHGVRHRGQRRRRSCRAWSRPSGSPPRSGRRSRHATRDQDRARRGAEDHRGQPQGAPRLSPARDLRGGRGAARHRGEVDPRRRREPARQLRPHRGGRGLDLQRPHQRLPQSRLQPITSRRGSASCCCTGRRSAS